MPTRAIVIACQHEGCRCSLWVWKGEQKPETCPWCKLGQAWREMRADELTFSDRRMLRDRGIALE